MHVLPVPVDGLRAAAQHLQVQQPFAHQRLKPCLRMAVDSGRHRCAGRRLLGILGDAKRTEQPLRHGTRPPRQAAVSADPQKPERFLQWSGGLGHPSGLRKTQWFWTFSRHLHLSFSAAWRLLNSARKTPKTGPMDRFSYSAYRERRLRKSALAEGEGFEPPKACTLVVFKTTAIDHSAIPPARTNNTASYPARRRLTLRVRPGWPSQTTPGSEMRSEAR